MKKLLPSNHDGNVYTYYFIPQKYEIFAEVFVPTNATKFTVFYTYKRKTQIFVFKKYGIIIF